MPQGTKPWLPGTNSQEIYRYGTSLLPKRSAKAMEVFELNRRLHPEERFWTFLGFDRTPPPEISPTPFESWEMVIANVRPNLNAIR